MTYYCENCYRYFSAPILVEEGYGMPWPWRQQFDGCPYCGVSGMIEEVRENG